MIVDAVVIGAGPNGLVAANDLADRGWDVVVLEAQPDAGGAVRSGETIEPGFVTDRFSAFYPLAAISPHIKRLDLGAHGLRWSHAPAVLAHPTVGGPTVLLSREIDETAASLDRFSSGDGHAWRALQKRWNALEPDVVGSIMAPFPPVRAGARLAVHQRPRDLVELVRTALLPVRRLAEEHFGGEGAALLLAGSALHSDLTPDAAASGLFGWMLTGIGQAHGWPVPVSGAGALSDSMVRRLESSGGRVRCGTRVVKVEIAAGRAVAVHTADGERIEARRAILADVVAPKLYRDLIDEGDLPTGFVRRVRRFQPGSATFKVNWTLDRPIPWTDPDVSRAGTVHLARSFDELTLTSAQLASGTLPSDPFLLLGQMTTADPTRSPAGTESAWAYTNVPQTIRHDAAGELDGLRAPSDVERFARRLEQRVELFAPGFSDCIRGRELQPPHVLEAQDSNLIGGDQNLGTAQIHQQIVFRPTLGLARAETPVKGLYLASASAHPGGGVHGACGANAARAAAAGDRVRRVLGWVSTHR